MYNIYFKHIDKSLSYLGEVDEKDIAPYKLYQILNDSKIWFEYDRERKIIYVNRSY